MQELRPEGVLCRSCYKMTIEYKGHNKFFAFSDTHGPAYGYLDRGLGCKNLFLSMASAGPKCHIFGHIHEEGLKRKAMLGGTTNLNVSYFVELRNSLH